MVFFLFSKMIRPALQSTQPFPHLELGNVSPDLNWAGRETDHIVPRLKNSWSSTSTPRLPSWLASLYNYVSSLAFFFPLHEPILQSLYPQKRFSFHIVFSHVPAKTFLHVQPYSYTERRVRNIQSYYKAPCLRLDLDSKTHHGCPEKQL
jgi:hypothetical protein